MFVSRLSVSVQGWLSNLRARRAHARRGPRTIRLDNSTGATLRLCIEPIPAHYDIPPGDVAELRNLDPEEDVLDIIVHKDASVSIYSLNVAVFVSDRRLSAAPDA
jgi:hypothetical protein